MNTKSSKLWLFVFGVFFTCDAVLCRYPVRWDKQQHGGQSEQKEQSLNQGASEKRLEINDEQKKSNQSSHLPQYPWNGPPVLSSSFMGSSSRLRDRWDKLNRHKYKDYKYPQARSKPTEMSSLPDTATQIIEDDIMVSASKEEDDDVGSTNDHSKPRTLEELEIDLMDEQDNEKLDSDGADIKKNTEGRSEFDENEKLMETLVKLAEKKATETEKSELRQKFQNEIANKDKIKMDTISDGSKFTCKSEIPDGSEPRSIDRQDIRQHLDPFFVPKNGFSRADILEEHPLISEGLNTSHLDKPQSDMGRSVSLKPKFPPVKGFFGRITENPGSKNRYGIVVRTAPRNRKDKRYFRTLNRKTATFSPLDRLGSLRGEHYPLRQGKYMNAIDYLRRRSFIERPRSVFIQQVPDDSELELQLMEVNDGDDLMSDEDPVETLRMSHGLPRVEPDYDSPITGLRQHLLRKQKRSAEIQRHVHEQIDQRRKAKSFM